jgi:hypothetical protein
MIKNVSQFSPSGGRYSILNRDFSLKESTENVARSISLSNKLYHFFYNFYLFLSCSNCLAFWNYKFFMIIVSSKLFYDCKFIFHLAELLSIPETGILNNYWHLKTIDHFAIVIYRFGLDIIN